MCKAAEIEGGEKRGGMAKNIELSTGTDGSLSRKQHDTIRRKNAPDSERISPVCEGRRENLVVSVVDTLQGNEDKRAHGLINDTRRY